ncbi:MAG: glutamate synthase large chain, partial [Thermoleophilaceae bacterium]|nr:glutamate synthase large chain [Thermoleophilaceae bacterium]
MTGRPGLSDPAATRGSCGIAALARLDGRRRRDTVRRAIEALSNLEHRGAAGADPETGDGAGILIQLPDTLFRGLVPLPHLGDYGVAMCFLPTDRGRRVELKGLIEETVVGHGLDVLTWREVPVQMDAAGAAARESAPRIEQLFVASPRHRMGSRDLERELYRMRRIAETAAGPDLHIASFSSRTIVYKGLLTAPQLARFYPDLRDERLKSALAIVHSRFSTNTFPSWQLAHPYRMVAHNGEINTLRG